MKRLVLEVSSLFGELAIEKVNNMYRLTQEDDMLYFTPSEIIHLTQIEKPYTDKIVSINDEHKIHFYSILYAQDLTLKASQYAYQLIIGIIL